jgi:hypothetical protein
MSEALPRLKGKMLEIRAIIGDRVYSYRRFEPLWGEQFFWPDQKEFTKDRMLREFGYDLVKSLGIEVLEVEDPDE